MGVQMVQGDKKHHAGHAYRSLTAVLFCANVNFPTLKKQIAAERALLLHKANSKVMRFSKMSNISSPTFWQNDALTHRARLEIFLLSFTERHGWHSTRHPTPSLHFSPPVFI